MIVKKNVEIDNHVLGIVTNHTISKKFRNLKIIKSR